jgi:hypothetical protein
MDGRRDIWTDRERGRDIDSRKDIERDRGEGGVEMDKGKEGGRDREKRWIEKRIAGQLQRGIYEVTEGWKSPN